MINIELYRRSGFRPCCDLHVDYKPCDCDKFGASCVVDRTSGYVEGQGYVVNKEEVRVTGGSPKEVLEKLLEQISDPLNQL